MAADSISHHAPPRGDHVAAAAILGAGKRPLRRAWAELGSPRGLARPQPRCDGNAAEGGGETEPAQSPRGPSGEHGSSIPHGTAEITPGTRIPNSPAPFK